MLALAVDQLLGLIESGAGAARPLARSSPARSGSCVGTAAGARARSASAPAAGARYVVGAKNFSEQYILADADGRPAAAPPAPRSSRRTTWARPSPISALKAGEIDAYVDYSGTLWANVLKRTDNPAAQARAGRS